MIKFLLFAALPSAFVFIAKDRLNLAMMRFFRDLSRFKARKRLYGNSAALIPLLMGKEEPIDFASLHGDGFTMTLAELKEFDGRTESTPVYLAVQGYIFDVSANRKIYGPGGQYHVFAARDATRALATGCAEESCFEVGLEGLTDDDFKEIDRWLELYRSSDKYYFVGTLVADVADELAAAEAETSNKTTGVSTDETAQETTQETTQELLDETTPATTDGSQGSPGEPSRVQI